MLWFLVLAQGIALLVLLIRLSEGRTRRPPLEPLLLTQIPTSVSVVVPTLNEEERIAPCLEGLHQQGALVKEIIIVDSRSTDGTVSRVQQMAEQDARFRAVTDDPLPPGWVGRPWALQYGLGQAQGEWVLGIDADTVPQPGLVAALIQAAQTLKYDVISLSPRFILQTAGENWLHPALLMTLVYRFGPTGTTTDPDPTRVMANGQCFLARREALLRLGGYQSARSSFCDDVTLARYLAQNGLRVGFLDGAKVLKVRMYQGFWETWREWGRSLDLKDASTPRQQWADVLFLGLVQGLPIPLLLWLGWGTFSDTLELTTLLWLNGILLGLRLLLLFAVAPSFEGKQFWFWLSPLADPLAALRIFLSTVQRPKRWRGRAYP